MGKPAYKILGFATESEFIENFISAINSGYNTRKLLREIFPLNMDTITLYVKKLNMESKIKKTVTPLRPRKTKPKLRQSEIRLRSQITADILMGLLRQNKNPVQIGIELNISSRTIQRLIKLHKLSSYLKYDFESAIEKQGRSLKDELYQYVCVENIPTKDIAKIYKINIGAIQKNIRKYKFERPLKRI